MAITIETKPYEILIRFNRDGSTAAQAQSIERIISDGAVIGERVIDPVPLATAGPEFDDAVGAAIVAVAAERDAALAQVAALQQQIAAGPAASAGGWLLKTEIIGRLSDIELAAAEAALASAPLRQRVLWRDAVTIERGDAQAVAFFSALFGDARAAEIMA